MSDRIVKTLSALLIWVAVLGIATFNQWFIYMQHQKGRVTESDSGFRRHRAKKIWLLLCGLPVTVEKLRVTIAIAQIQAMIFGIILLMVGFFFPGIPIADMNILLFITYAPLKLIIEMIFRRIRSSSED